MNKEIEEILNQLKNQISYVENLNENVDDDLYICKNNVIKLLDYITNLQEENKSLKEHWVKLIGENLLLNEIQNLQQRIDKAIDFISFICFNSERPLTINECHKLYAILKGSDKE